MTGSAATIRPATAADAVAWAQLRLGLWPDADDPLETLVAALAEDAGAVFSWRVQRVARRSASPKCACAMTT